MRALGETPTAIRRFHWVTKGIFDQAQRVRYLADVCDARRAASLAESVNMEVHEAFQAKAAFDAAQLEVIERSGLHVGRCPMSDRVAPCRQLTYDQTPGSLHSPGGDMTGLPFSPQGSVHSPQAGNTPHNRKTLEALSMSLSGSLQDGPVDSEEIAAATRRELMASMTSEELIRFGTELRGDRFGLEERLGTLGKASEVITNLSAPFYEGALDLASPSTSPQPENGPGKRSTRMTSALSFKATSSIG